MVCIFSFLLRGLHLAVSPSVAHTRGAGPTSEPPEGDFPGRLPPAFINKLFKFR